MHFWLKISLREHQGGQIERASKKCEKWGMGKGVVYLLGFGLSRTSGFQGFLLQ
jgi:hypothetical protein